MFHKTSSWWWLLLFLIPITAFIVWVVLAFSGGDTSFNAKREVRIALAELKKDPHSFSAAMRAGVGYYNLGLFDKAVEYYQLATTDDGSSPEAWNNLGNTYRELLRYDDAEAAYKIALPLKEDLADTYLNIAELYRRWPSDLPTGKAGIKDWTKEIPQVLKDGLTATGNDSSILKTLIDYYQELGDEKSAEPYQKILQEQISTATVR